MSIDVEVDFEHFASNEAHGEFSFLFLSHIPENIRHRAYKDFGRQLLGDELKGYQLRVVQQYTAEKEDRKSFYSRAYEKV